jgi:hypothetical protein
MRLALSEDIQMFDPSNFQLLDESVSENDPCAVGIRMLMLSGDVPLLTGLVYAEYRDPMPTPMPGVLNARGRHCHQSSRHDSCRHHVDSASPDSLTFENVVAWLINEEWSRTTPHSRRLAGAPGSATFLRGLDTSNRSAVKGKNGKTGGRALQPMLRTRQMSMHFDFDGFSLQFHYFQLLVFIYFIYLH